MSADLLFTLTDEAPALVLARRELARAEAVFTRAEQAREESSDPIPDDVSTRLRQAAAKVAELERRLLEERRAL